MKRLAAQAAFKLSRFLQPRVDAAFFKTYSRLIAPDVTEEELAAYPETPEALFPDNPALADRYRHIHALCGGDSIALAAVQLYLLALLEEPKQTATSRFIIWLRKKRNLRLWRVFLKICWTTLT